MATARNLGVIHDDVATATRPGDDTDVVTLKLPMLLRGHDTESVAGRR